MGVIKTEKQKIEKSIKTPLIFVMIIGVIHIIQVVLGIDFGYFGVHPRHISGLIGIFLAPLIHGSFMHLFSNIFPFFLTFSAINYFYPRVATRSFSMIYLLTGLAVWLFARNVYHIGASGIVYGLVSFLFWSGIFRRSLKSVIIALIVVILYSGYISGILPNQEGISWESHLIGGIIGIFTAYYFKNELEEDEVEQLAYKHKSLDANQTKQPYFTSSIFDLTKKEREILRIEAEREVQRQQELKDKEDDEDDTVWFYDIT